MVRAADGTVRTTAVTLELGRTAELAIRDEPRPTVETPAPSVARSAPPPAVQALAPVPAPPRSGLRTAGWVVAGVGAAALATGGVLGWRALVTHEEYVASPTRAEYDSGRSLVRATNVALVTGGALLAAGGALLLWPVSAHAPMVAATPAGLAVVGRF
jgi:hypothetical protein